MMPHKTYPKQELSEIEYRVIVENVAKVASGSVRTQMPHRRKVCGCHLRQTEMVPPRLMTVVVKIKGMANVFRMVQGLDLVLHRLLSPPPQCMTEVGASLFSLLLNQVTDDE